jgi:succinyl-diaminopimelate desuccinylase
LYEALPIIEKISKISPVKQPIFGVDFYDVISITESMSTPGRTTVPDTWTANINYRFSPVHSMASAKNYVCRLFDSFPATIELTCISDADAGGVVDHPMLKKIRRMCTVEAKQAWTDVAQLTSLGICAFNFGPGCQHQAHMPNEYVVLDDMLKYEKLLSTFFMEDN